LGEQPEREPVTGVVGIQKVTGVGEQLAAILGDPVLVDCWDSWEADALVVDRDTGVYVDHTKVHRVDFDGTFYRSRGPLNTLRPPYDRPVLCQAGASPKGREFAARYADTVIATATSPVEMKAYRDDMRARENRSRRRWRGPASGWTRSTKSRSAISTTTTPAGSGTSPAAWRSMRNAPSWTSGCRHPPEPERHAIFRIDFDDPRIDWRLADGDAAIAPGVRAVLTAGHTPGHQSFVVDLDESVGGGGLIFAFDAADLTENIDHELAIGGRVGVPPEATVEPIRRLKAIAAETGYQLVPGHDPVVWPRLTDELARRFATTGD
jgi:hypothetical protein